MNAQPWPRAREGDTLDQGIVTLGIDLATLEIFDTTHWKRQVYPHSTSYLRDFENS